MRMSVTDDIPSPIVSDTTADALGGELARGIRTRAERVGEA